MRKHPDDLDMKIINLLREDGRMPNTRIAKRLGVSEGSVRRRIGRMNKEDLIRIAAFVNQEMLGYEVNAVIAIKADPAKVTGVANILVKQPEVKYIGVAVGEYDIMVSACFKANSELLGFLTDTVGKIKGITRTQTFMILDVLKHAHDWVPM
ncbi:Lrp/AsnC family transcriptional regulator [Chloroflexota bacterium]